MLYIKALHIVFMVTWFAGLFYMVRLFVYDAESSAFTEPKKSILKQQFRLMQKRLWLGITWPGMIMTWVFGFWMVWENPWYLGQNWFWVKLSLVAGLLTYHLICHKYYLDFKKDSCLKGGNFFRIWNEVATLFLVAIVFVIVLKDAVSWIKGVAGLVILAIVLMSAIKIYKKLREH